MKSAMKIQSKIKDYSVQFIDNLFEKKDDILSSLKYHRAFYFVDGNVHRLYKDKLRFYR